MPMLHISSSSNSVFEDDFGDGARAASAAISPSGGLNMRPTSSQLDLKSVSGLSDSDLHGLEHFRAQHQRCQLPGELACRPEGRITIEGTQSPHPAASYGIPSCPRWTTYQPSASCCHQHGTRIGISGCSVGKPETRELGCRRDKD